jgi:RecJ-like exonuclease
MAPPDPDPSPLRPGDQAPADAPDAGENICPRCGGSGTLADGVTCPECDGTGTVIEVIGGE